MLFAPAFPRESFFAATLVASIDGSERDPGLQSVESPLQFLSHDDSLTSLIGWAELGLSSWALLVQASILALAVECFVKGFLQFISEHNADPNELPVDFKESPEVLETESKYLGCTMRWERSYRLSHRYSCIRYCR